MSLLKRSLEIVEDNSIYNDKTIGKKRKKQQKKSIIPERNRWNDKLDKPTNQSEKITYKNNTKKFTVNDAKIQLSQQQNIVDVNVRKLLSFNQLTNIIDDNAKQKIIKRAQTGKYVIPEAKPAQATESVFTEEDFRKFEREYFCS